MNKLLTILNSAQTATRKMINKKITRKGLHEYLQGVSRIDDKEKFEREHAISYSELAEAFRRFFEEKQI